VVACFGAEVANETSVLPTDAIKILDLRIDVGAKTHQRRKRVVAKSPLNCRADVLEIEIEYFKAEGFFRSEVIGKRSLWHSRSRDDVADARTRVPALMHDAETLAQYFFPMRRLAHHSNMYVRI
jgi:hypothetical protein